MVNESQVTADDSRAVRSARGGEFDLDPVRQALKGLRFGEIRVIVQDGVIVQIDRVEKQRLR